MNGIILNGKIYLPEKSERPCVDCDLKSECQHGLIAGRACGIFLEDYECFRYSQPLTDKLNRE